MKKNSIKKLTLLIAFTILIITTSCVVEMKNKNKFSDITFEKSELFGNWIETNSNENQNKSKTGIIKKLNLKKDMTTEIKILDSTGYKTVYGSWKINHEKKVGSESFNVSFKSDIVLTFDWNSSQRQILMLSVKELNKKKILTSQKGKFEKE